MDRRASPAGLPRPTVPKGSADQNTGSDLANLIDLFTVPIEYTTPAIQTPSPAYFTTPPMTPSYGPVSTPAQYSPGNQPGIQVCSLSRTLSEIAIYRLQGPLMRTGSNPFLEPSPQAAKSAGKNPFDMNNRSSSSTPNVNYTPVSLIAHH